MNERLSNTGTFDEKVWRAIRNPLGKRHANPTDRIPDSAADTREGKLEILLNTFLSPPEPNNDLTQVKLNHKFVSQTTKNIRERLNNLGNQYSDFLDQPIKLSELNVEIAKLQNYKAMGPDRMHNTLLKHLYTAARRKLVEIFNKFLRKGVHPIVWNSANITPIPKPKKDLSIPKNCNQFLHWKTTGKDHRIEIAIISSNGKTLL